MKTWTQSAIDLVAGLLPRRRRKPPAFIKPRPRVRSSFEDLERREVPTATSVIPFATIPAQITTAGQTAQVVLHFTAGQISSDRSAPVLIGFYVKPATGSAVVPQISEVDGFAGPQSRVTIPERGGVPPSKALFIAAINRSPDGSQNLTVDITSPNGKLGNVILEAFLPGDVQGDGTVNAVDLAHVQAIYGSAAGQSNYDPASDFNFDGHVGCIDRRLTQLNLGAHAAYTPPAAASVAVPAPVVTPTVAPVVQATPAVTTKPAVTPTVQATPVAVTTVAVTPVVATPVAVTPVAVTPAVQATPVAVTTTLQASPIAVTTQQATTSITPVQSAPIELIPVSAASTTTTTNSQTTGSAPVYLIPVPQSSNPAYAITSTSNPTYVTTSGTTPVPLSTSASQVPLYYYGQPVGSGSTSSTSATPLYYYGQPVVQAPASSYAQTNLGSPVYYYGQPVVQAPAITQVSTQARSS